MLIDTHCHLNLIVKQRFEEPISEAELTHIAHYISQAQDVDVHRMVCVGTGPIENDNCLKIAATYAPVYAAIGIHPTEEMVSKTGTWKSAFSSVEQLAREAKKHKIVGIGETGIDLYHAPLALATQKDVFSAHIACARVNNLPLIVHTRNAAQETLDILHAHRNELPRGVIHCFSYDMAFARQAISLGFMIGLAGNITHPNKRHLSEVAKQLPLEHVVLETDAPWLTPHPHERTQNSPAAVATIAAYVAQLRGTTIDEISRVTSANACQLFALDCA